MNIDDHGLLKNTPNVTLTRLGSQVQTNSGAASIRRPDLYTKGILCTEPAQARNDEASIAEKLKTEKMPNGFARNSQPEALQKVLRARGPRR